jgi:hypothetical protein
VHRDSSGPRNALGNTLLFGSVLKMLGSFGTADFSDRLDMFTIPALGSVRFPEWSCLRPSTRPRFFVYKYPRFLSNTPPLNAKLDLPQTLLTVSTRPAGSKPARQLSPLVFPASPSRGIEP